MVQTHRLAYELTHGEIPEGQQVMHLCNRKRCCNPEHLTLGSGSENTQMAADDGLLPWKRLGEDVVREIRQMAEAGHGYPEIADHFGISHGYAWEIGTHKKRGTVR